MPRGATADRGYSSCGKVATSASRREIPPWRCRARQPHPLPRAVQLLAPSALPAAHERVERAPQPPPAGVRGRRAPIERRSPPLAGRQRRGISVAHAVLELRRQRAATVRMSTTTRRGEVPHELAGLARPVHRRLIRLQWPLPGREHLVLGRRGEPDLLTLHVLAPARPRLQADLVAARTSARPSAIAGNACPAPRTRPAGSGAEHRRGPRCERREGQSASASACA